MELRWKFFPRIEILVFFFLYLLLTAVTACSLSDHLQKSLSLQKLFVYVSKYWKTHLYCFMCKAHVFILDNIQVLTSDSHKLLKHQVMFQILFLNLILLWRPSHGAPSHGVEVDVSVMTPCPYPLPEMIQPCQCFADQSYKGLVLKHFTVFLLTEIST